MTNISETPTTTPKPMSMRKVALASMVGTALETYDLYIYGLAAALIFAPLFFTGVDPAVGTILALATFAVSFLARPVGAVFFGHFGDRIGRRNVLITTLLMMGLSTAAIGVLPNYNTIGIWAPLLLVFLRFAQGFAFGGEFTGAVLLIMERAPKEKRGFYSGLNQLGPVFGFLLSTSAFILVSALMSEDQFLAWGWRVLFLFSIVLVGIGLYLRFQITEAPAFQKVIESKLPVPVPIFAAFRHYPKELVLATLSTVVIFAMFYLFSVYSLAYGVVTLHMDRNTVLASVMIAMVVNGITIPIASKLSDRIGRRKIIMIGIAAAAVWAFPMYGLIDTANFFLMTFAFSVQMIIYGVIFGPIGPFLGEVFGVRVRYSGMALAYNLGGILGAAFAPIIATLLVAEFHASWPIALYIVVLAVVSFTATVFLPNTNSVDIATDRISDHPARTEARANSRAGRTTTPT